MNSIVHSPGQGRRDVASGASHWEVTIGSLSPGWGDTSVALSANRCSQMSQQRKVGRRSSVAPPGLRASFFDSPVAHATGYILSPHPRLDDRVAKSIAEQRPWVAGEVRAGISVKSVWSVLTV